MNPKDDNPFAGIEAAMCRETGSVRKRGLKRLLFGGAFAGVMFYVALDLLPRLGYQLTPHGLMVAGIPASFGLIGFMEFTTGVPFQDWVRRWDSLKGWQRGIIGSLIALAALILFMTIGIAFSSSQ